MSILIDKSLGAFGGQPGSCVFRVRSPSHGQQNAQPEQDNSKLFPAIQSSSLYSDHVNQYFMLTFRLSPSYPTLATSRSTPLRRSILSPEKRSSSAFTSYSSRRPLGYLLDIFSFDSSFAVMSTALGRRQSSRAVRSTAARPQNYYSVQFSQTVEDPIPPDRHPVFFPAITHFTDALDALPREVMRHFSMMKEVEAKLHAPDEELAKLATQISTLPRPST